MNRLRWLARVKADASAKSSDRFWSKVDRSGGPDACWPWTAYRDHGGYGVVHRSGHVWRAHRLALTLLGGDRPGLFALHRCDNRPCCNPSHLYWGTHKDNANDRVSRNRDGGLKRRGDRNGTRLHPESVVRGSASPAAKLTEVDVQEIRSLGLRPCEVQRRYGVSPSQAKRIVLRQTWKHVDADAPSISGARTARRLLEDQ